VNTSNAQSQQPPSEETSQQPSTSHWLQRSRASGGRLGVCRAITSGVSLSDFVNVADCLSTDAGAVDALVVCEQLGSFVEDNVGALHILAFLSLHSRGERGSYVVQRTPGMTELNDLNGGLKTIKTLIVETTVACLLDAVLEVCAVGFLEAEDAGAGLVEGVSQTDVEVCRVGAQGQVHVGESARVAAVDLD
jgi:hypothetical protein